MRWKFKHDTLRRKLPLADPRGVARRSGGRTSDAKKTNATFPPALVVYGRKV